jgi:UrcA family protein
MNTPATVHAPAETTVRVPLPKVTIAMILCGIVSAAGIGAASAATAPDDDVPSVVVKYQPAALLTDSGARTVYRKIVSAAEQVCPQNPDSRILNEAVRQCRAQSITRAVMKINNSKLAAIHDSASGSG